MKSGIMEEKAKKMRHETQMPPSVSGHSNSPEKGNSSRKHTLTTPASLLSSRGYRLLNHLLGTWKEKAALGDYPVDPARLWNPRKIMRVMAHILHPGPRA